MTIVKFYDIDYNPPVKLTYSVIAGRYKEKWIYVRHHKRTTLEIAGGHIEPGESADEAAVREFREETGANDFAIICLATYSVEKDGLTGYGRFYFAQVESFGSIPDMSEVADVTVQDYLPENLTHPDIQPHLFKLAEEYLNRTKKDF